MTNKEAKDVLLNYTCCCKYGTSPNNCSDEECVFGKAIKTLCNRPQGEKEPVFKSVPTYRKYEDYHDAEQYVRGWNDAMRYIFGIEEK